MDSNEQLIENLIKLLENPDEEIASKGSQKLISMGEASIPFLQKHLTSSNRIQRLRIIQILGEIKEPSTIPVLINLFYDEDWETRKFASDAVVKFGAVATPYLTPLLQDEDRKLRYRVLVMLRHIKDASMIPALINSLKVETNEGCISQNIFALAEFDDKRVIQIFHSLIKDAETPLKRQLAYYLGRIGNLESITILEPLLVDDSRSYFLEGSVGSVAEHAIQQILERSKPPV